jgi:hypothetical protein
MRAARLGWSLVALDVLVSVPGLAMLSGTPDRLHPSMHLGVQVAFTASLLVFAVVGALIVSRQPGNAIGWLMIALGVTNGLYTLLFGYVSQALAHGRPAAGWAWVAEVVNLADYGIVVLLLQLFPTGSPATPRWRFLVWITAAWFVLVELVLALAPGPFEDFPTVTNPLGVHALHGVDLRPIGAVLVVASLWELGFRLRRSRGRERLQLKWFVFVAALVMLFLVIGEVGGSAVQSNSEVLSGFVFAALLAGIPAAIGIAILRHDLYDIDVVINRTLVYGSLTAILAGVYVGSVLVLQLALDSVTSNSSLAVAASTLAVAALFRPVRARIQAGVDRRFYRRKYDAARTLERFSARLREEVDLDALGADLREVVRDVMQPAHISLWLRSP